MFGWDFEFWNLIKIYVRPCYFGKQNSTLGSVVPLAMFSFFGRWRWMIFAEEKNELIFLLTGFNPEIYPSTDINWASISSRELMLWRELIANHQLLFSKISHSANINCGKTSARLWRELVPINQFHQSPLGGLDLQRELEIISSHSTEKNNLAFVRIKCFISNPIKGTINKTP